MSFARLLRRYASRRFATVATSEMPTTTRTFYKRVLPPTGVAFSSPRGQEIFKDALGNDMVCVLVWHVCCVGVGLASCRQVGGGTEPDHALPLTDAEQDSRSLDRSIARSLTHDRSLDFPQLNVRVCC